METQLQSRSNRPGDVSRSPRLVAPIALVPLALSLSGCAVIETIFKAGVWVGVIAVAIVLALAFGVVRLMSK